MSNVIHVDFRQRPRVVLKDPSFRWEDEVTDIDEALAAACRRHIQDIHALLDEQEALYGRIQP